MRLYLFTLCALLLVALPLETTHAAETLDEKVYDPGQTRPGQTAPGQSGGDTIIVVPSTPGQTVPGTVPGQTIPGQLVPSQNGTMPVQPDTQKETPTIVVPPVPTVPSVPAVPTIPVIPVAPELPKSPDKEKKDIIVTPVKPVQPVKPEEKVEPKITEVPKTEDKLLTPADFLPTTPEKKAPEKAKPKPKEDPKQGKTEKAPKEAQPEKTKPEKAEVKPEKADPKKDKPRAEKKKGEALSIPADAGKTGNMDFLEGCWRGRLSGRAGSQVIDNMGSRFCFDANGKGKHYLYDPKRNETCVGSANGGVKPDGTLRVDFDNLYCPSGETWYPQGDKYMTCRDGGNGADCKWYYKGKPRPTGPYYRD